MDFKEVFSTQVLPIIQTNKPSVVLKKCTRCKKAYDGFNFKFNRKQCISCQEKQLEYRNKVKGYRSTIGVRVTVLLVKIENQTVYGYRIGGKHNTTAFLC
jgi:hypothetical protein